MTFNKTATYLKVTIKGSSSYLATTPNPFDYYADRWIYFRNMRFPKGSSPTRKYQIYMTLYKSDVVNPTFYRKASYFSADPR